MPDILAIVSKAIFERDARVDGKPIGAGDVWPVDRYTSTNKALQPLEDGGRIFLVTVRPPNEQLWFVGVVDGPEFDGTAWVAPNANSLPITNISRLRKTIVFESGKGMMQDKGTLGMSLQTPRTLAKTDIDQILAASLGSGTGSSQTTSASAPVRIIGGKYGCCASSDAAAGHRLRRATPGPAGASRSGSSATLKEPNLVERCSAKRATGAIDTRHIAPCSIPAAIRRISSWSCCRARICRS